uniref:Nuclear pore complex protein Nup214-like n=1 Tax=Phallusia mammillata TaxID=59560 RepID=A0A6F9DN96_9ASCI|nr:nuclear pore complex protein Nup214-like [Phallusia mammillata]
MAEEDLFPPEIQKLPTEFGFREFGNLTIETGQGGSNDQIRYSLLSVANIYGLTFVGCRNGLKVFSSKQLLEATDETPDPIANLILRSPPHWIAVSSDNLTLAVCSTGDKGLQVLFFDTRNLVNKTKPTKTPFAVHIITKSNENVVDLHWNPAQENAFYLAICVSDGTFQILAVQENVQEVAKKSSEFGACTVCWSPKGKQMVIGRKDGSLQQYTPTMEIRRTIPVCENIDQKVKVCDLLWLSTYQVAVTYVAVPESNEAEAGGGGQPSLFLANLPPAKEQNKSIVWTSFEDPCYGMSGPQAPHFYSNYLDKWNLFVLASSRASETAVLGKNKQNGWEIWNLDDSCRVQLPMQEESEQSPLGTAVMYNAKKGIVVDDTRECGPMPVYTMLSTDGKLCLFHIINLQPVEDYPNLIVEAKQLSIEGERSAVPSNSGSLDVGLAKPLLTPSGKQKLAVKPSLAIKTSTPKVNLGAAQDNNQSQLSLTPVQGFQQPMKPLSEDKIARSSSPVAKSLTSSFTMLKSNPAFTRLPESPVPSMPETDLTSLTQQPPTITTEALPSQNSAPALRVQATKSAQHNVLGSGSPFKTPQPKPQTPVNLEQPAPNRVSSLPSFSEATPESSEKLKRKSVIGKTRERVNSIQSTDAEVLADSIRCEIVDFDRELASFLQESAPVKQEVEGLDVEIAKSDLQKDVVKLCDFRNDIIKLTTDQHDEIKTARTHCLETFSALKNVEMRKKRIENPAYRNALHSRQLDLADKRKMKDVRSQFQYIREAIKQTDSALDEQWQKFIQSQKSSSVRKSKRRMQMEETNMIHKVILNQMQVLHEKERAIMLLGQQMDKLKLLRSSAMQSPLPSYYKQNRGSFGATGSESADLSLLADSLIHDQSPRTTAQPASSQKQNTTIKISPKKTSQLSQILGSRKNTPVRATSGARSNFIVPPMNRRKDLKAESSLQKSELSQASSFDSEPSDSYSTDLSSGTSSEIASSSRSVPSVKLSGREAPHAGLSRMAEMQRGQGINQTWKSLPVKPEPVSQFPNPTAPTLDKGSSPKPTFTAPPPLATDRPKAFIRPGDKPISQSPSPRGTSTLTYGGPENEVPHTKPIKFDGAMTEAASNLNNPPKVVNIKELREQPEVNLVPFSATFQAKDDVPPGAAAEVQKVLDSVVAERQKTDKQQTQSMSMLPNSATTSGQTSTPIDTTKKESSLSSLLGGHKPAAADVSKRMTPVFGSLSSNTSSNYGLGNLSKPGSSPFSLSLTGGLGSTTQTKKIETLNTPAQLTTETGQTANGKLSMDALPKTSEKTEFGGFAFQPRGSASSPSVFELLKTSNRKQEENKTGQGSPKPTANEGKLPTAPTSSATETSTRSPLKTQPPSAESALTYSLSKLPISTKPPQAQKTAPEEEQQKTPPAIQHEHQKDFKPKIAIAVATGSVPEGTEEAPTERKVQSEVEVTPGSKLPPLSAAPASAGFGFGGTPREGLFSQAGSSQEGPVFGKTPSLGSFSNFGKPVAISTSAPVFGSGSAALAAFGAAPSFDSISSGQPPASVASTSSVGSSVSTATPGGLFGTAASTATSSGTFGSVTSTSTAQSGLFSAPVSTAAPSESFGTTASTTTSSGPFGTTATPSGPFGAAATTAASSGPFGTAATTAAPSGPFGAPASIAASSGSFGAPVSTAASSGPFGTAATTAAPSGPFGAPASTTTSSGPFGTAATTAASSGPFGASASTAAPGGSFGFGGGGGGFLSGLGSSATNQPASNPFAAAETSNTGQSTRKFKVPKNTLP